MLQTFVNQGYQLGKKSCELGLATMAKYFMKLDEKYIKQNARCKIFH